MPKYSQRISFFFPAYRDQDHIPSLVRDSIAVLSELTDDFQVLIIDDGSPDRTADIAARLCRENHHVRLIRHNAHRGYGAVLQTGLENSWPCDFVCFTDGDYPIDLTYIPGLISLLADADGAITRRTEKPYGLYRHLVSNTYNLLVRALFRLPFHDVNSPLKAFRSSAFSGIQICSRSPFAPAEILIKTFTRGLKISQVDITSRPKKIGPSYAVRPMNIILTISDLIQLWWEMKGPVRSRK